MSGIFLEQVELINRAPIDLSVMFDGQSKTLKPGKNFVPRVVVEFAKNQNPIMGSANPYDPHISGAQYLVGLADSTDDCTPLTLEEWEAHLNRPCREDEQIVFQDRYGSDPKAKLITYGKGRKSTGRSRSDAGGTAPGISEFSSKD